MRTRNLAKSKRAIVLLKACTVLSIIKCLFVGKFIDFALITDTQGTLWYLWFAFSEFVPALSLAGARKVRKVLEGRENFVRVSSSPEDAYV